MNGHTMHHREFTFLKEYERPFVRDCRVRGTTNQTPPPLPSSLMQVVTWMIRGTATLLFLTLLLRFVASHSQNIIFMCMVSVTLPIRRTAMPSMLSFLSISRSCSTEESLLALMRRLKSRRLDGRVIFFFASKRKILWFLSPITVGTIPSCFHALNS